MAAATSSSPSFGGCVRTALSSIHHHRRGTDQLLYVMSRFVTISTATAYGTTHAAGLTGPESYSGPTLYCGGDSQTNDGNRTGSTVRARQRARRRPPRPQASRGQGRRTLKRVRQLPRSGRRKVPLVRPPACHRPLHLSTVLPFVVPPPPAPHPAPSCPTQRRREPTTPSPPYLTLGMRSSEREGEREGAARGRGVGLVGALFPHCDLSHTYRGAPTRGG